ncbi:hypothetical protein HMPREF9103_02945 [Lentilactobacillus parafarraginis F0439]|uniref:Uncharacterized protein n=1 Tax=Lentilactobacillus parafarraginis F0439 TaxID=797515 RepID=G9ZT73_9LACO|nr:hypothetical protein [Lentilactobacillus parafarraginis]EHL95529.1 hypothetical protein HMPREF9103_02945 [Lentilactobacillus parafarraginis F0439]
MKTVLIITLSFRATTLIHIFQSWYLWVVGHPSVIWNAIISIIPIVISIIALKRSAARVEIVSDTQPEWIKMMLLDSGQSIINAEFGQLHLNFQALNSSGQDMGFFDLGIINDETGEELSYNTRAQFNPINGIDANNASSYQTFDGEIFTASIPESYSGIFPAHALTSLDLFIHTEAPLNRIKFTVKLAKRSFHWRYIWTREQRGNFRYHAKHLSGIRNVPKFPTEKYAELKQMSEKIKRTDKEDQ